MTNEKIAELREMAEALRKKAFRGPTMEAVHTKTVEWNAADGLDALLDEVKQLRRELCAVNIRETNLRARLDAIGSLSSQIEKHTKAGALPLGGKS